MENRRRRHVLVIPYPIASHSAPLSSFCHSLASQDGSIHFTILHTHANLAAATQATGPPNVHHMGISDGLPVDFDRRGQYETFFITVQQMGPAFEEAVKQLQDPPACIISDPNFCWVQQAANKLGIPLFLFITDAAAVFAVSLHARRLVAEGYFGPGRDEGKVVDFIPGLPALSASFLPFPDFDISQFFFHLRIAMYDHIDEAAGVLLNTFDELEGDVIDGIRAYLGGDKPVLAVGPCIQLQSSFEQQGHSKESETRCLKWLDSHKGSPGSVVYVAFGTLVMFGDDFNLVIAEGLKRSGLPFLWATQWAPPQDFLAQTQGQGLVVSWAPQPQVLAHPSVGAFVTHCGWNSIVEAMTSGVPLVCCPQFLDQLTNCRLIVEKWKTGVEVDSLAAACRMYVGDGAASELARVVRGILLPPAAEEGEGEGGGGAAGRREEGHASSLRARALRLREAAQRALSADVGSSTLNIRTFASLLPS